MPEQSDRHWRNSYDGTEAEDDTRLCLLERERTRLDRIVVELENDTTMLKGVAQ